MRPALRHLVNFSFAISASVMALPSNAQWRGVVTGPGMDAMSAMGGFSEGPSMNVVRMSDADLTCEQIYAEAGTLEKKIAAAPPPPDFMRMAMEEQSGSMAISQAGSVASSILSMVPGVGAVAGGLISTATSMASTPSNSALTDAMLRYQESAMANAYAQGRHAHLTQTFLKNGCRVSTLDPGAVARAFAELRP